MSNQEHEDIEKLKKELHYLRQIKEALDKTMIISKTDPQGIITDANEMFEKISGYKKEELIGKPHNIVRHPQMPKSFFKKMWDTLKKGKIFKGVVKNQKKDGGEYYVLANIVPITDEDGNIKEYIAIRQDITKRMKLQKEQEQFINNILEYFLSKFKHPSFTINKYSDLIQAELNKENPSYELIKEYNLHIKREGLRLQRMYNVLKTLIDFKNKTIEIKIEPINLVKIIHFLYKKYKPVLKQNVNITTSSKEIVFKSDKKLMFILFEILFLNVLNFTKNNLNILISEKNTNIYIEFESDSDLDFDIKNIDFFAQLKNNKKNIGIGLYLAKKIADIFKYEIKKEKRKLILIIPNKK